MPRFAKFDIDDEPIEGYRLVDFLGKGQYGEVWKALDLKSGKKIALKIIDLTHSSGALKELRALNQVKNLNHPNLVPIFTARLKDRKDREVTFEKAEEAKKNGTLNLKELIIAMGLGEQSLAARLKECNPDGTAPADRKGLPFDELIQYMEGAAKGIDFLNRPDHGLGTGDGPVIHCDIKPDNMMIVSGEIQVADCGVAVMITPDARQTRAAGSPAYSPPELTANKPSQGTDQYSLAVSYYELRTGNLPFDEEIGLGGIIIAHSQGALDFSLVGEDERAVLKKATAIRPKERFETCLKFVKALIRAAEGRPAVALGTASEIVRDLPRGDGLSGPSSAGFETFAPDRPVPAGRSGAVNFDGGSSRPALPGLGAAATDGTKETPRAEPGRHAIPANPDDPMGGRIRGTVEMDPDIAAILGGKTAAPGRPAPPPPPTTVLKTPAPRPVPPPPADPARHAIPADPDDPMGGRIRGTVEMDPAVQAILQSSGSVPTLPGVGGPPRPAPAGEAPKKPKVRPPAPPMPPPPDAGPKPEPIWLQQADAETRRSGPIQTPEKRKSGPVPKPPSDPRFTIQPGQDAPAYDDDAGERPWPGQVPPARRSGGAKASGQLQSDNWRQDRGEYEGGGGKPGGNKLVLALGLVAVLGLVGVGVAVLLPKKDSGPVAQADPPPTKKIDDGGPPTTDTKPKTGTEPLKTEEQKAEDAVLAAASRADVLRLVVPAGVKPTVDKRYAALAVQDLGERRADPKAVALEVFGRAWTAEAAAARETVITALHQRIDPTNRRSVFEAVAGLKGAEAFAADLAGVLVKDGFKAVQTALEGLADPKADARAATAAVRAWLEDPAFTAAAAAVKDGLNAPVVQAWYQARQKPAEFQAFAAAVEVDAPPAVAPAGFAAEYFRLAPAGAKPVDLLAQLTALQDRTKLWALPDPAAKAVRAAYDARVAAVLRTELDKPDAPLKDLGDAVGKNATGWGAAVRAEALADQKLGFGSLESVLETLAGSRADAALAAYANYVLGTAGSGARAAKAFAAAYGENRPAFLDQPQRKTRVVSTLIAAAVPSATGTRTWANPYRAAADKAAAAAALKTADELSGRTDARLALHLALAADAAADPATAAAAAKRATAIDPKTYTPADLAAARAFFADRAARLQSSDPAEGLKAAAAGARVAYRMALGGLKAAKNDADEADLRRDDFDPILNKFVLPYRDATADPVAAARLAITDACLTALDPTDPLKGKKDEIKRLLGRLNAAVKALAGDENPTDAAIEADPDLADAVGCRAFLSLWGCAPYYGGLYSAKADSDRPLDQVWKDIRKDAAAAISVGEKAPVGYYFGNITRLYTTMAELRISTNYACPAQKDVNEATGAEVQYAADASANAAKVRVTFGKRAASDAYALAKFLFMSANQLAKLGDDPKLVKAYLLAAKAQTDLLGNEYRDFYKDADGSKQFNAQELRAFILEDLAWLSEDKPAANFKAAIAELDEAMQSNGRTNSAPAMVNLFRMRVRNAVYARGEDPFLSPQARLVKDRPKAIEGPLRVDAYYWTGVTHYYQGNLADADAAFADAVDAAGDQAGATVEKVLLALVYRARIAAKREKADDFAALIEKANAVLGVEFADGPYRGRAVRDVLPHYAVLPDYFAAKKAVLAKDPDQAKAAFARAFDGIVKLDGKGRMMIEEPFALECLADELATGTGLSPAEVSKRKSLLRSLLRQFTWSLPPAERARVTAAAK